MSNKYAQVIDGVVTNVLLWDGVATIQLDGELIKLEDGVVAGPKWLYRDGVFSEPLEVAAEE